MGVVNLAWPIEGIAFPTDKRETGVRRPTFRSILNFGHAVFPLKAQIYNATKQAHSLHVSRWLKNSLGALFSPSRSSMQSARAPGAGKIPASIFQRRRGEEVAYIYSKVPSELGRESYSCVHIQAPQKLIINLPLTTISSCCRSRAGPNFAVAW
jgi:hypothetical protein